MEWNIFCETSEFVIPFNNSQQMTDNGIPLCRITKHRDNHSKWKTYCRSLEQGFEERSEMDWEF